MPKAVNYTEEQTKALVIAYENAKTVADRDDVIQTFAGSFGKSIASIRAKLSREGVYVKKERTTKDGRKIEKKTDKVARIAELGGRDLSDMDYFEKLRHVDLDWLIAKLS